MRRYISCWSREREDSGLQFSSECSEDVLDRNWQRLILTHLDEKEHRGVLTGSALTDVRITLISGRAHQKHTEGGRFPTGYIPGGTPGADESPECTAGTVL